METTLVRRGGDDGYHLKKSNCGLLWLGGVALPNLKIERERQSDRNALFHGKRK